MYSVYKHTCPNGKVYIGMTQLAVERRWKSGGGYKAMLFGRAIAKYGWDNITHEVLAVSLSKQQAEKLEIALILKFNSSSPACGYNVDNGGHNASMVSEATRKKQRLAHIGKTPWNKGRPQSDETKRKLRESLNPSPVVCIETAVVYPSIQNAAKLLSIPSANILQACKGQRKTAGRLHWRFTHENKTD